MREQSLFAQRREAYMEALGERACAIVHSPPEVIRNGDAYYPFRQSSDLYYLTGFVEPETTLVLRPGADDHRVVLFVRPRDPERETWDGKRAGVEGAVRQFGADVAYPVDELDRRLPGLIANVDELHYSVGIDPSFDTFICAVLSGLRKTEKRGKRPPRCLVDPRTVLHELRLHKDADEVATLRRAAEITAEAHTGAMKLAAPGVNEGELAALLDYTYRRRGGSGPGYTSIVGGGANSTILHYIENDQPLVDGDLVLIDSGCEYEHYTADVTRTFPVSGRFSTPQRQLYELVLDAQNQAVTMARPGVSLDDIHDTCVRVLTTGMKELGLLDGELDQLIEDKSYRRYFMHGTSHWLGLDVHDVGAYTDSQGVSRPLEPGMVITVEPGIYVAKDDEDAPEPFRGIGIRIEDDVLITDDGHENLTAMIPKNVADVEAACRS